MRNINIQVLAALAVAAAFTSCNANDDNQDNTAVRFTATVDETTAVTKASGTTWAAGDAIGIFMVGNGTETIAEGATNKQYTTTGTSTFTAVLGNEIYYPMDGSAVDFIAYYPHKTGTALTAPIAVEVAAVQTAANQPGFDLLYATATGTSGAGYDKTANATTPVALAFGHKLAKLVMNCTAGSGVTAADLAGMAVTIKGMNTKNTFDLATGTLGTPGTPVAITPRTVTNGSVYDAIILPGNYADGTVTVEFELTSNEVFTWEVDAETFAGGNEYTYTATLARTGVSVTGTITPWTTIDRGGVTAE